MTFFTAIGVIVVFFFVLMIWVAGCCYRMEKFAAWGKKP